MDMQSKQVDKAGLLIGKDSNDKCAFSKCWDCVQPQTELKAANHVDMEAEES